MNRCAQQLVFHPLQGFWKGNEALWFWCEKWFKKLKIRLKSWYFSWSKRVMYFWNWSRFWIVFRCSPWCWPVTMEARCYGFAKRFWSILVNTVVGFIGPEYLYDSKQVIVQVSLTTFMVKLDWYFAVVIHEPHESRSKWCWKTYWFYLVQTLTTSW